MTIKFVAYVRVSTAKQGRSGLGLEAQRAAVTEFLHGRSHELLAWFTEIESGKKVDREQLDAALSMCRLHGATLVIAKLDRLARNVEFISRLMNSGVEFVAADMSTANRFTVHIMAAMAEHEREMISLRTKAALSQAKSRGTRLGGNRGKLEQIASQGGRASGDVRKKAAMQRASDLRPIIAKIQRDGAITVRAIAAALNAAQVPTLRGGPWGAGQVALVMKQGG